MGHLKVGEWGFSPFTASVCPYSSQLAESTTDYQSQNVVGSCYENFDRKAAIGNVQKGVLVVDGRRTALRHSIWYIPYSIYHKIYIPYTVSIYIYMYLYLAAL